jgi:hypothetical protein
MPRRSMSVRLVIRALPALVMLAIALSLSLGAANAALQVQRTYGSDFENVALKYPEPHNDNSLNMGISNSIVYENSVNPGGATVWMEGLDKTTPGVTCHRGTRCLGMELFDITKSRRNEFNIEPLNNLAGDQIFVSVWLYLPSDWQTHTPSGTSWYSLADLYFPTSGVSTGPYGVIYIKQTPPSPNFILQVVNVEPSTNPDYLYINNNFPLPRGRWFNLQYYVLRSATNGRVIVWLDGQLLVDASGYNNRGTSTDWETTPAKIYYDATYDTFSPYRIWVDDLEIYNREVHTVTSVSLNTRLDASSSSPTVEISGSIYPAPGDPMNVTLEFSNNQGGTYQEMTRIKSAADGTFNYSWKTPGNGLFMIRADVQGVKSPAVSIGTSSVPGFPVESLVVGYALGLLFIIMGLRQRASRRVLRRQTCMQANLTASASTIGLRIHSLQLKRGIVGMSWGSRHVSP